MTAAALGTTLTLDTLDGIEDVVIAAGTQSGSIKVLRGKGVPHLRSAGRGDLHVHLDVTTPTKLDIQQEELLRQLAELRGEERPELAVTTDDQGLFSRLRGAFGSK